MHMKKDCVKKCQAMTQLIFNAKHILASTVGGIELLPDHADALSFVSSLGWHKL